IGKSNPSRHQSPIRLTGVRLHSLSHAADDTESDANYRATAAAVRAAPSSCIPIAAGRQMADDKAWIRLLQGDSSATHRVGRMEDRTESRARTRQMSGPHTASWRFRLAAEFGHCD